ncbi:glycoside hydrolase family 172 protein [Sphingobacterium pedocola]|uniref:DUF2961 domain-containing protein n=1 Tax=Sphingobacterium pedocola TaxID=2082722 RepID=A0ABR9TA07_9SPHI|nr:glycoside hydrolase family 172 protein [Sphingobacterium pedocola]MBE8721857.1 hypothetical protein [Sphingobacterium pedocola]
MRYLDLKIVFPARRIKTFLLLLLIGHIGYAQEFSNDLIGLATIKEGVKTKRVSSYDTTGGNADSFLKIEDGTSRVLMDIKGAGIINHIWITLAPEPEKISRNDVIIKMYWDGSDKPSVLSPLGPFFGQGWEEAYEYAALPLVAGPKEGRSLVSYFAMPFEKGARIEIENQTGKTIDAFYFYVDYVEMNKLPKNTGRFHAWYNKELTHAGENGENEWGIFEEPGSNLTGKENYLIADIKGKGHFVGVNYYVHSPTPFWYGEGDDMIFIDGADQPTLKGTGTEDYFNTAWCPDTYFVHPYFGYPRVNKNIGWLGRTHMYRFHISDPIYFDTALKFTIEHGHNNQLTLDLASVAYWYQKEVAAVPATPNKEQRKPKPVHTYNELHKWRHEWRKANGNAPDLW